MCLFFMYTFFSRYLCNRCGPTKGAVPKGSDMFACRACDYDICPACVDISLPLRPPQLDLASPTATLPNDISPTRSPKPSGPNIDKLRELTELLSDPLAVTRKAEIWLSDHDIHNIGSLGFPELKILCTKLNGEFGIPAVDDSTVEQCIRKFDTDDDKRLNLPEFRAFYNRLLLKIRDHYGYVKVKRNFFLSKSTGKPTDWYRVKKTIGQGSFGIVQLVEDKRAANRLMVMKTINKRKTNLSIDILEQEIKNLRKLDHPNIIKIMEYFDDAQQIYIIMENADGGELLKVVEDNFKNGRYVNEKWAMEIFKQVLEAICYCHARGVMHKDLKAENIMLLNSVTTANGAPHAVVIDFGLAEMFDPHQDEKTQRSRVVSGTPYSMSPEVWAAAINKNVTIGYKCDIYSLGCVAFHVLTGEFPVMAKTNEPTDWLKKIKLGPNWRLINHCSADAIDLVKKMMTIDERIRPTARECLSHPWFLSSPKSASRSLLSDEQLKALIKYNSKTAFEKAVYMKIATSSKVSELARVNKVFYQIDTEANGFLDRHQCAHALEQLGMPKEIAAQTARSLDADGNNRIDYTELVAGVISVSTDHIDNMLWTVFTSLDTDNNGQLDVNEIKHLLNQGAIHNIGLEANEKEIKDTILAMDTDKSGTISFQEFKDYFLSRK